MSSARCFAGLSLALIVSSTSSPAHAWQCFPEPHTLVLPSAAKPAPRNTHVRVRLRHGPLRHDEKQLPCDSPFCDGPEYGLALRPAGEPDRALPFALTKIIAGDVAVFDLRPLAPLEANARYEVWRTDIAGRDTRLLSSFTTDDRLDEAAPRFPAITQAQLHPWPLAKTAPTPNGRRGKVVVLDFFEQFAPYVAFEGPLPSDDGTRTSDLAFFVWSAPAGPTGAPIDYARPPTSVLWVPELFRDGTPPGRLFAWGSEGICYLQTLPTPFLAGRHRVGVRVVDLAGNQSEAQEREIDFGK